MAVTYKDIDLLTQKSAVAGTEKLPVSDTEYITPAQIAALASGNVPIITTLPSSGMLPNKIYDLGTIQGGFGTKTFTLAEATDTTIANVWQWTFIPSNSPTIAWPQGVTWDGGSAPVTQNGYLYEISVRLIGTYKVAYYKEIALT